MRLKLPPAPGAYSPSYDDQRNRLIEAFAQSAYIKGEDVGIYAPAKLIYEEYYGEFTKTDSQTPAAANTAYALTLTNTEISQGVSIGSPASRVVIANAGIYSFLVSVQITSTNSSQKTIWVWLRKNGTNIPNSAKIASISLNNGYLEMVVEDIISAAANDYFEIMFAADDVNVTVSSVAATAFAPAAPAISLSVIEIDQL
jgi:hypothetical protein